MILIIIKFGELLLEISLRIVNALRSSDIKHAKECFIRYPSTSKLVKKNSAALRFLNPLFSVWISEETFFLVFDVLHQNTRKLTQQFLIRTAGNKEVDRVREGQRGNFVLLPDVTSPSSSYELDFL